MQSLYCVTSAAMTMPDGKAACNGKPSQPLPESGTMIPATKAQGSSFVSNQGTREKKNKKRNTKMSVFPCCLSAHTPQG